MNPWTEFDLQMADNAKNSLRALVGTGRQDLVAQVLIEVFPHLSQSIAPVKALPGN